MKTKTTKRFTRVLSLALALVMTLALSATAFAADTTANTAVTPKVSTQQVHLDLAADMYGLNTTLDVPMYNINGNNYIKLRDFAYLVTAYTPEKESKYSDRVQCEWDAEAGCVKLTSHTDYTAVGGEMTELSAETVVRDTSDKVMLDGEYIELTGYNINNNNYYKLRDIGAALDFAVYWDYEYGYVVISSSANNKSDELEAASKEKAEEIASGVQSFQKTYFPFEVAAGQVSTLTFEMTGYNLDGLTPEIDWDYAETWDEEYGEEYIVYGPYFKTLTYYDSGYPKGYKAVDLPESVITWEASAFENGVSTVTLTLDATSLQCAGKEWDVYGDRVVIYVTCGDAPIADVALSVR